MPKKIIIHSWPKENWPAMYFEKEKWPAMYFKKKFGQLCILNITYLKRFFVHNFRFSVEITETFFCQIAALCLFVINK